MISKLISYIKNLFRSKDYSYLQRIHIYQGEGAIKIEYPGLKICSFTTMSLTEVYSSIIDINLELLRKAILSLERPDQLFNYKKFILEIHLSPNLYNIFPVKGKKQDIDPELLDKVVWSIGDTPLLNSGRIPVVYITDSIAGEALVLDRSKIWNRLSKLAISKGR
jgi:hypothetical protein